MQDIYHADQSEEESIPSFATQTEGLLSQIRDTFPDKLRHQEEQRLSRDCVFHGCKKNIWDSVNFCFANPHLDYMHFLEECRKAEEEGKVAQAKAVTKAKVAAATVPLTKDDKLAKQLNYQQHQIDELVGQSNTWSQLLRPHSPPPKGPGQVILGGNPKIHGDGALGEGACLHRPNPKPHSSPEPGTPSKSRGLEGHLSVNNVGRWGI